MQPQCPDHTVLFVGKESSAARTKLEALTPAKKTAAKRAPARKAVAEGPAEPPPKKATARKAPTASRSAVKTEVTLEQILQAVPALKAGHVQPLGDVVNQLHNAKLIGKNAASTKLFKKFPDQFALTPERQPNQVRYLAP